MPLLLRGIGCLLRLAQMLELRQKLLQAENGMAKQAMAEEPAPLPWGEWYPSAWLFFTSGFWTEAAPTLSHAPGGCLW